MIYKIKNKYYVKVQGYYKEVTVNRKGNDLDVKPVQGAKKLEVTKDIKAIVVNPAKEDFNKRDLFNKEEE